MIRLPYSLHKSTNFRLFPLLLFCAGLGSLHAQPAAPDGPQVVDLIPLILVDQDTNSIIELLEEFTGKYAIRAQNVPQVSINFKTKDNDGLSLDEAVLVIESLLSLNGVAITNLGDNEKFFRVLPTAGVNAQVPDFLDREVVDTLPASQKVFSTYFDLDFLTVEQAMPKIQPFLTPGVGTTVIFEKSNSFLITDALINIQRIKTLLKDIDKPARTIELKFYTLKYMDATEMQQRFQGLAQGPLKTQLEGNTVFEADERTNMLMVLTHRSNLETLDMIIEKLDVNVEAKTKSKVFSVKHAESKEVESLITQVISNQQSVRKQTTKKTGSASTTGAKPTTPTPKPTSVAASAAAGLGEKNLQFSDYVIIVADERSNSIVASGTESDLEYIEKLIEQIDVLLAQVRIEAIIAEVSLTRTMKRGIEAFQPSFNVGEVQSTLSSTLTDEYAALDVLTGSFAGRAGRYTLDFVYDTAKSNANVKVLSSPAILTTHNQEALINVSESRPIITATQSSGAFTNTTTGYTNSQVQYRDIGIQLKVKPLIGSNGVIQMEIEQKIEDVGEMIEINGNPQPVIKKREANSFVSVNDQEVIILGGLQSLRTAKSVASNGLISMIPIVNNILGNHDKDSNVKELIIFLKPYVINNVDEAGEYTRNQIEKLTHGNDIGNFTENGAFKTLEDITTEEKKAGNRIKNFLLLPKDL